MGYVVCLSLRLASWQSKLHFKFFIECDRYYRKLGTQRSSYYFPGLLTIIDELVQYSTWSTRCCSRINFERLNAFLFDVSTWASLSLCPVSTAEEIWKTKTFCSRKAGKLTGEIEMQSYAGRVARRWWDLKPCGLALVVVLLHFSTEIDDPHANHSASSHSEKVVSSIVQMLQSLR